MSAFGRFLARVKKGGVARKEAVTTTAMGRAHTFRAWDLGEDTFIFEEGVQKLLGERPSVLIVPKNALKRRAKGMVLSVSTGNHSVAAFPLLDGRFWKLAHLAPEVRGDVLMKQILCANIVNDVLEVSQRDITSRQLFASDDWLQKTCGLELDEVIMLDRNELVIDHYRRMGQDWRVKPLAWTTAGQQVELSAARKKIATKLRYYHNSRGVHFLTYPDFCKFAALADAPETLEAFVQGLRELVAVYEGNRYSFLRMPKYRGHHEIELFGLRRGAAMDRIVPELDKLMESIVIAKIDRAYIAKRIHAIAELFAESLVQPELKDGNDPKFVESLYMHVTGEIYAGQGDGAVAFDDRRTALPGATFVDGVPVFQPGADERTRIIFSNMTQLLSKDEVPVYANVYEIRTGKGDDTSGIVGEGKTRELVYTTSWNPIETSVIEKRLENSNKGYGAYTMTRIGALKALGIALPSYKLLRQDLHEGGRTRHTVDYYLRSRCEGEAIDTIPANYFCSMEDASVEERETVLDVAMKMGDAAAQNMIMKKFDSKSATPLFGEKEIYEFEYSVTQQRIVPKSVAICSIRGAMGWPCLDRTEENLQHIGTYYMTYYAHYLKAFQRKHQVPMLELADRFMEGFEYRTNAIAWQLSVMRDKLEGFTSGVPAHFGFNAKWAFVLWALERQERRLEVLRRKFFNKVEGIIRDENVRNNPQPVRVEPVPGQAARDARG